MIRERLDIPKARDLAKQNLQSIGLPPAAVMSHLLVISEAVTNILKHAKEGKLTIAETGTSLHVVVEDTGPGFPLKILPYATLMAGYSTKKSLEHVRYLASDKTNTTTEITITLSDLLRSLHGQSSELSNLSKSIILQLGKFTF